MMISTRGRYALRMLIDLARNQKDGYITLKEIADRQGISEKYLENIVKKMIRNRLIESQRGKGGGYRLSRPAGEIGVSEVLTAMERSLSPVSCLESEEGCPNREFCSTLPLWQGLNDVISAYLGSFTVEDLVQGKREAFHYQVIPAAPPAGGDHTESNA